MYSDLCFNYPDLSFITFFQIESKIRNFAKVLEVNSVLVAMRNTCPGLYGKVIKMQEGRSPLDHPPLLSRGCPDPHADCIYGRFRPDPQVRRAGTYWPMCIVQGSIEVGKDIPHSTKVRNYPPPRRRFKQCGGFDGCPLSAKELIGPCGSC